MKDILKKALQRKNMTQKELAELLYVTPQAVSKWIKGDSLPSLDNVMLIRDILDVDLTVGSVFEKKWESKNMETKTKNIEELDSYEKAKNEANVLIRDARIGINYSHAVCVSLSWLLTAVIGLTHHIYLKEKDPDSKSNYWSIFGYLDDYLRDPSREKDNFLSSELEREFYMLGGELFESFGDCRLPDHDYCKAVQSEWHKFQGAVQRTPLSNIYNELSVAITELIEFYTE